MNKLMPSQKKGASFARASGIAFTILVVIVLAQVIFSSSTGLGNTTVFGSAPTWVYTLMVLGASIGLVKLVMGGR